MRELGHSDHRKIGQRQGLFKIDPTVGVGLPLWLPAGTVIREELEKLAKELEFQAGFERVATPQIARTHLYVQSGHLPYFCDDMYPVMEVVDGERERDDAARKDAYVLRPMNCPHHHRIFAAEPRSYRDLPLRLAEYGQVYRWERSGALTGLARVRGMCMNDGHIYCAREQVRAELASVLDMYRHVYELLGIERYRFRLSRRDPADPRGKYVDDASAWRWAESLLADLLRDRAIEHDDEIGHAAFYGPKIDVQVVTAAGTEETLSTVQLDFAQPRRMGLSYAASGGRSATPYCIHRAPLGTHERFVAFLAESYEGAFPTWLAPTQVLIVPVSDRQLDYAERLRTRLRQLLVRAALASPGATVARTIRQALERRIPNVVVIGDRERANGSITLRRLGSARQTTLPADDFERVLVRAIAARARVLELP
jgi:threonyl-tRNA synthetase